MKTRSTFRFFLLFLLMAAAWFSLSAFSLRQPVSQGTNPGDPYFYYTISYDAYGNPCYYFPNAKAVHCGQLNSYVFAQLYPPKPAFQYPAYQQTPYYNSQYPNYQQAPYYSQYPNSQQVPYYNQYYPYNPYAYNYYGSYYPYSYYYYNRQKWNSNAQAACHAAWVGKDGAIIASERMGRNWRIQYCEY